MSLIGFDNPCLQLRVDDHRFLVHGGSAAFLHYRTGPTAARPYIASLGGPSGRNMVEDGPFDHFHHHGVWWGHGDVNGVDFYLELASESPRGTIEHLGWNTLVDDPPAFGFVEDLQWSSPDASVLLRERRSLLARFDNPTSYTVDLRSQYTAAHDLHFGDTKESALPGIRVAEALSGTCGGVITSSNGAVGEQQVMGQPAQWVDYSGTRRGALSASVSREGIACFDHPSNPWHPSPFFAREYGPFSPFEGHHFVGKTMLAAGESFSLRHCLVVHDGDATEADLQAKFDKWRADPCAS